MISPLAFALAHLAILLGVMVWAAFSARGARTEPWRHRNDTRYRRLTDDEVLRRLARKGRWDG